MGRAGLFCAVMLAGVAVTCGAADAPIPVALAEHVTVRTANERTTLDRATGKLISTVDVTLFNLGGRTLLTPYHAAVALTMVSGTVAQVEMPGALGGPGAGPYGTYYVDLSTQFPQGLVAPNASAATTLTFIRDRDVRFTYAITPYAPLQTNSPPNVHVAGRVLSFTVDEGDALSIPLTGDDPDGEFVVLAAAPAISNATFDVTNGVTAAGVFAFAPAFDQAGEYAVLFTARDPQGFATSLTVRITVNNVNQAPALNAPGTATVREGNFLSLALGPSDPDDDAIEILATGLPTNAVVVPETGMLYFAPDFTQAGVYPIGLQPDDGSTTGPAQTVVITVTDAPEATAGNTNALILTLNPMPSPSLLRQQRVSGAVNGGALPPPDATSMALITGLNLATGERGATQTVAITGQAAGLFATHFAAGASSADFGAGISVQGLTVAGPNQASAQIAIAADAALGPRAVSVTTSNEVAVSIVAFNVIADTITISGTLVDAATSNAIAGAIITVQGTGFSTVSGADGRFSLSDLPPGDYVLLINPPDHEPVTMPFTAQVGQDLVLGSIGTAATVFDPSAPASASLRSVLGRGMGSFGPVTDMEKVKQTVRDTLVLVGGSEAGVLDAYGNQLNGGLSGAGLVSLRSEGVARIAERIDQGESAAITEILFAFTHTFDWTNGAPFKLADWLEVMQAGVNQAWLSPNDPDHYLAIVMFNGGRTLSPTPPVLTPETRLNPLQRYMFVMSLLSYMADPQGTSLLARVERPLRESPGLWAALGDVVFGPAAYADDPPAPPPPADRRWTSYWRGASQAKDGFLEFELASAYIDFANMSMLTMAGCASGNAVGAIMPLTIAGLLETRIAFTFGTIAVAQRVPEPPKILRTEMLFIDRVGQVDGNVVTMRMPRVRVTLRRSSSDPGDDPRYVYTLYRFRSFNEGRQAVNFGFSTNPADAEIEIMDLEPFPGSTFYAATVTRLFSTEDAITPNGANAAVPWWNVPLAGITDPFLNFMRTGNRLISDYSDPFLIYVGSAAASIPVNPIEVDAQTRRVYYALNATNIHEQAIYYFEDLGEGDVKSFAGTGFAAPGFQGLGLARNGDLYSHNKASDAMFGGRLFRFDHATRAREHVGQINYFSRDLLFANPVDGQGLVMGPGAAGGSSEDLYTIDMLAGQVKRAPVTATYDPFRRVGQPYAPVPFDGRPIDMEFDRAGNLYVLLADALPRAPFNDREKGRMHIPPGAPIKTDCPPEQADPHVDPVYLFSGEFYEDVEDIRIKGVGLDFVWTRKYRSKIGVDTLQGRNWDVSYNIHVTSNASGIVVHDGHTRADTYVYDAARGVWALKEFFRELHRDLDGTFRLEFEDRGQWVFYALDGSAQAGRIQQSIDRHGNTLSFFYDGFGRLERINDTLNRDIFFAYNADGYVDSITDFAGRVWRYEYYGAGDTNGNPGDLKAAISPPVTGTPNGNNFPAGKRISYTYSTGFAQDRLNGNLLTITDPKGQTWLKNVYTAITDTNDFRFDRLERQVWGNDTDIIDLVYEQVNPTTGNGGAVIKTILNDRNGNVKEYYHNAQNQVTVRREYTGRAQPRHPTTSTLNRPAGRLRVTDPDYFETRFVWNDDSLMRMEIHPNGNITEYVYEGDLDPNASARSRGNVRTIRHRPGSHTPAGDQAVIEEHFEYDTSHGRGCCGYNFVTRQTDGRGNVTHKAYDALGNLTQTVNRVSGITEEATYDSRGRVTRNVSPDNGSGHRRVDRFVYYGPGDGHQNGYLRQLIQDDGGLALTTTYEYDNRGNIIRLIDARGNDTLYTVNTLDMVVRTRSKEVTPGSGLRYQTDTYYDANGNVVQEWLENRDETGALGTPAAFVTTYTFDILNQLTRKQAMVDASHAIVTEYVYDGNRNLVLTRFGEAVNGNQPANVLRTVYDERDMLFRTILAEGTPDQATSQTDYDANGNTVRVLDGLEDEPREARFAYDGFDRKVREIDALGNETVTHYDANNQPVRILRFGELEDGPGTNGNVRLAEMLIAYDPMNRKTQSVERLFDAATQAPIGSGEVVTRAEYNDCSQVTRIVDANGHSTFTFYDGANRTAEVRDHLTNRVVYAYDENGNLETATEIERADLGGAPVVSVTTKTYDGLNRAITVVDNAGNTNRMAHDSRGNTVVMVDGRGNVVRQAFDGLNRRTRTTQFLTSNGTGSGAPAGTIVLQERWDDSNRLVTRTDDNGNVTRFTYDALNRLVETRRADGTTERLAFDVRGNVVRRTDANGTVVQSAFDLGDRVVRRDIAPGPGVATNTTVEAFAYDGLSRTIRVANDDSRVERRYDSLSRVTGETADGLVSQYSYDGVGNRVGVAYPGGRQVTTSFDGLNRRRQISDGGGVIASYDYIGHTRVARRDLRNGTRLSTAYDAARRVIETLHVRDPNGTPVVLDRHQYAWDAAYNKVVRDDPRAAVTQAFTYDSMNRLVRSVRNGGIIDYTLDGVGNRQTVSAGADAGAYVMSTNAPVPLDRPVNQYTQTPTGQRVHDENGNVLALNVAGAQGRTLSFDYQNRLVAVSNSPGGPAVTFRYDALGRRLAKRVGAAVTRYVYDGSRVIEERDAGNAVVATYVYGNTADERLTMHRGGQDYYYHGDEQQHVVALTDAAGAVVERYDYADYGTPDIRTAGGTPLAVSAVGNPYLFTGRQYDGETGLYDYRTRYLDPRAGRFVSRDALGDWGDPVNLGNAQAYVGNNPWSRIDPTGESAEFVAGLGGGVGTSVANTGLGMVQLGAAVVYGAGYATVHPIKTLQAAPGAISGAWNGMGALFTKVAAHPDGIAAGWAHVLAPDLMRKGHCWEYISDYERGHAIGQVSADVVGVAWGGGQMARAARLARLARASAPLGAATSPGRKAVFTRARIDAADDYLATAPENVEDLLRMVEGVNAEANVIVKAVRNNKFSVLLLDEEAFVKMSGSDRVAAFYEDATRTIIINRNKPNYIRSYFIHEGTHAVRHARGDLSAKYNTVHRVIDEEVAAHMAQFRFEVDAKLRTKMPSERYVRENVTQTYHHDMKVTKGMPYK